MRRLCWTAWALALCCLLGAVGIGAAHGQMMSSDDLLETMWLGPPHNLMDNPDIRTAAGILAERLSRPPTEGLLKPTAVRAIPHVEAALARETDPTDRSRIRLLLGHCYVFADRHQEAIGTYAAVLESNPDLVVDFPEARIWGLSAETGMSWAHYRAGNWEKTIEWGERILRRQPEAPAVWMQVQYARRQLGLPERSGLPPAVAVRGAYLPVTPVEREGRLLVPAQELALRMGLAVEPQSEGLCLRAGERTLCLRPGSRQAQLDGQPLLLSVAPERAQGEVLVPLRCVAEGFGLRVDWDPLPRIAWVR